MDLGGEVDAFAIMVSERLLQVTEEAAGAGNSEKHTAKFAKELLVPLRQGDSQLMGRHTI
jgi:hypothetical protein